MDGKVGTSCDDDTSQLSLSKFDDRHDQELIADSDVLNLPPRTNFSDLPIELRLQVWHLLIPPSRVLRMTSATDYQDPEYARVLGPVIFPTLLHICHESREFAKTIYRLGFAAVTTNKDRNWWSPPRDILYLPHWHPPLNWDLRISFNFQEGFPDPHLDELRDDSGIGSESQHVYLARVQHLALPFNSKVLNGINFGERSGSWLPKWLSGFPDLRTVSLLMDHFPQWYRAGGIELYEPTDVPINNPGSIIDLAFNTPSSIERKIALKLEEFKFESDPDWNPPIIRIMVIGNGNTKQQSGFCLPIQSSGSPC